MLLQHVVYRKFIQTSDDSYDRKKQIYENHEVVMHGEI